VENAEVFVTSIVMAIALFHVFGSRRDRFSDRTPDRTIDDPNDRGAPGADPARHERVRVRERAYRQAVEQHPPHVEANARRRQVPESVVMRMSGHRTRSVFDRYNIVEDEDVRQAVRQIEAGRAAELTGRVLDTSGGAATSNEKAPSPNP
jgi:hypothetical protein